MRMQLTKLALLLALAATAGCGNRNNFNCTDDSSCNLSGGGKCVAATSGSMWCAYPDPQCPDGYRYSDQDVGDGLAGECVANLGDGGVSGFTLTVQVGGSGTGVVSSMPGGVACGGGICTKTFDAGTQIMLSASAGTGNFLGWSNDCVGGGACAVTMDRDRTVTALFGNFGEALWSQQFGASEDDGANAITMANDGNVIVVGSYRGMFTVGTKTLSAMGQDIFVAKLSAATGDVIWIQSFGGAGNDTAIAVAVDSSDNVYVGGTFTGSIDFGDGAVSAANVDGYLLKLDSAGAFVWKKAPLGGQFADSVAGVAVRGTTVALTGVYAGTITVNGQTLSNSGTQQGYIVEWGTDGSNGLVKGFTGTYNILPKAIALDSSNNIVVAGSFNRTANFGGADVMSNADSLDVFLVKYSATGTHLFQKTFGGSSSDQAGGMSVDANDNIILLGQFSGSISFGGPSPVNANTTNIVVAKYSLAGSYQWAQPFGGTTAQLLATGASANAVGDVVVTGYFCGNLPVGTETLSSVGTCPTDNDIFSVRLARTDGSPITATRAGGSSSDAAYGITQASDGRHFLAGQFRGFAEFGGQARTSAGGSDGVILGLAPL
jgi:hypothetical protein